ncbi:MAG TPA: sugar ABC transporter substrate-binding protein [Anaerolineales bacterium]|nr:sugar ABC transporter substrate-binding protein [Anaerolineales bacterium]
MNRKLARMQGVISALVFLALMLAACGAPATETGPAPEASEAPATEAPEPETPLIRRYEGETIRILMYEQVPTYSTLDRLQEFTDATGINVEYELLAESEMIRKETLDFSSHTGTYDVTNVHFWYIPQFAQAGYLEPLDEYVANLSVPEWDSMSDFVPSYLDSQRFEGGLYGLPFQGIVQILYYRTDLIDQFCGGTPPATMDDLMTCAQAITEGGAGEVFGYTDRGSADAATFMSPAGWIYAWGVNFLDENYHPQLTTPEAVAAMTHYVTLLYNYGPQGQAGMGWAEAEQAILNGVAAMHADTHDLGPDMVNPERSQFPDSISFAMPPMQDRYAQDFFASGLSINADSQHKEAAWLFVQWATAAATQAEQLAERSDFTVESILNSEAYRSQVPGGEVILQAAQVADPAYFPAIPEFGALSDVFSAAVSRMVAEGPDSVEDVMTAANAEIEELLAAAGYYD